MSWLKWFEIRGKSLFSISYSFHRLTGVVLAIYLLMHLGYLTSIRLGKEVYDIFISTTVTPTFLAFDLLLVLAGVYHGINGVRLIIHEFALGYELRKSLLYLTYILVLIVWLYASYVMYRLVVGV
ncbi:succinate dehydrogenase subunit C [Archaeoglobus sulfaticallidus PM70-1]|uniref:Succinate dehydrogenase subunit C n=1 Tax=Archaeoglobus sulfaticallidus PM70-1 TaxID=387631 RepID=N0BGN9_9EURY|nr:succinate dehydrogenase subunit C [Archaeoglobus sulfaticallidus]AGK62173.1 succinate dehydrogenase subunit C [Archaeoglobus sulfaticallidus PM70-1]